MGESLLSTLIVRAHTDSDEIELMVSPYAAIAASFIGNFIPNFVTFSFAVVLWICAHFFDGLNHSIESCLEKTAYPDGMFLKNTSIEACPMNQGMKLMQMRQLHDDL
jgi:hypothetical protein